MAFLAFSNLERPQEKVMDDKSFGRKLHFSLADLLFKDDRKPDELQTHWKLLQSHGFTAEK